MLSKFQLFAIKTLYFYLSDVEMSIGLYKVSEVARLLGISNKTVYLWIKKGKLHVIRFPSGLLRTEASEIYILIKEDRE